MKKSMILASLVFLGLLICLPAASYAITWDAWAVHGGSINTSVPGQITSTLTSDPTYHWNKSNWGTRTGQKAFYSTDDFNGMTVGSILSVDYNVTSGSASNVYFNIYVQDVNGKRAILAPADKLAGGRYAWAESGNSYSVFEAESGWMGTAATGQRAATWDQVKNLTISAGGPLELPDTVNTPHATAQGSSLYTFQNWLDWAPGSGVNDAAYDGFAIVFGQSTNGLNTGATINNLQVTAVPLPSTVLLLGSGLAGLAFYRKRRASLKA